MKKILYASVLTTTVFCSASSFAASTKEYSACLSEAGAVDPAVLDCMSAEYERQDKRLNSSYKILLSKLDAQRRKKLQEVQRLWVKYSDANCDFYYDPNGGTLARQMSFECSINSRAARADEFGELAKLY